MKSAPDPSPPASDLRNLCVIVPCFNEQESLPRLIPELFEVGINPVDIVVVDDGSRDRTAEVARAQGVTVLKLPINLGIGGAVQTGYKWAKERGYAYALQLDGDGQHDPKSIRPLLEQAMRDGNDITIGSRFVPGQREGFQSTRLRRLGIGWLSMVLRVASGQRVYDITSGMRLVGVRWISRFASHYPSDFPEPESLGYAIAAGARVAEHPVLMRMRATGTSSIAGWKPVYYMIKVTIGILLGSWQGRRAKGSTC